MPFSFATTITPPPTE